jgi:Tetratricopeptide repeat
VSGHLTPELVFGYENGLLSPAELLQVHRHVQQCGECRGRLAQSLDIEGMLSPVAEDRPRPSYGLYVTAAAIVLGVALSGWLWFHHGSRPEASAAAHIEFPSFIKDLNPPRQTLMGGPTAEPAGEMSPQGTAVLDTRPTFQWSPQSGDGWTYQVKIFGAASEMVLESAPLQVTQWRPEQDLRPEVNYQWQVTADRKNQRVTLPEPPSTPPRFRVVAPEMARHLRELATGGASHLELASAYAQAGLVKEAHTELDAAIQEHPDDPQLRAIRKRIR